jgi:hypothetical protein
MKSDLLCILAFLIGSALVVSACSSNEEEGNTPIVEAKVNAEKRNIELAETEETCAKVDGWSGEDVKLRIASKFETSVDSVRFLGGRWDFHPMGGSQKVCLLLFDTSVGPRQCLTNGLLSDDDGETAFGVFHSENLCYAP